MPTPQMKYKPFFLLTVFIFSFFINADITFAGGAYGWFSPKVQYVNNTTPTSIGCGTDEASIEFRLVEVGKQTTIAGSSGAWTVKVRENKTTMTELASVNFAAGVKVSTPLCFNPNSNGLQITVDDSANYHKFEGPTLFPSSGDLSSMAGKHFRGFLELESKADMTPSVESILPDGLAFESIPTFTIRTNSISNSYRSNQVTLTRFYAINQAKSDEVIVMTDNTDRTANPVPFSFTPSSFPDEEGFYFWTFQQELNGFATTSKTSAPSFLWTFSQIPSSGAPAPMAFSIDKSAPISTLSHSINSTLATKANVKITNTASDIFGTLSTSTISVYKSGALVTTNTYTFTNTNSSSHSFNQDLDIGSVYTVRATTTDALGHIITSAKSIDLTVSLAAPIISALNLTNTTPYSIEAFVQNNGLPVTNWGSCWSTNNLADLNSFLSDPSSTCNHSNITKIADFSISNPYYSIPVGVNIYMMVYAHSLAGTSTATFSRALIANPATLLPTISYVPPNTPIQSFFIDPGVIVESTGVDTGLSVYGICIFGNSTLRDSFNPSLGIPVNTPTLDKCRVTSTINPWAFRGSGFTKGVAAGTTYYFKAFAQNSAGWASTTGEATTAGLGHRFDHLEELPVYSSPIIEYQRNLTNFNGTTKTYNDINVKIAVVDNSTDRSLYARRVVNFTAKLLRVDGALTTQIDSKSGTTISNYPDESASTALDTQVTFNNVPLGQYQIEVTFTGADNLPVTASPTYGSVTRTLLLTHPNIDLDSIVGDETSSGAVLIVDPELRLWATPTLLRAGQFTTLNWSMNNIGADLQCEINGPKNTNTFPTSGAGAGSGTYSFNVDFASNSNLTGNISSGELTNTQLFELKCLNGTEEFATTTRVNTLGTVQEI
ncbi:MAG: hypothetical protein KBC78_02160 [Candidatus Pacebacteria bacterium]|nr:hypothetical protein [Candidatus Paceibacterota bacterium]